MKFLIGLAAFFSLSSTMAGPTEHLQKITPALREALAKPDAVVPVIAELPTTSPHYDALITAARKEKNRNLSLQLLEQKCKEQALGTMSAVIDALGMGRVSGSSFEGISSLNCTMNLKLTREGVLRLAESPIIQKLDSPRTISRE